jgi:hypothetical protein
MELLLNRGIRTLKSEEGVALALVLILSASILVIIAGLVYMMTSATQISGIQKRYKTALEAGKGGADITYQVIGLRGETSATDSFRDSLSSINFSLNTSNSCTTLPTSYCLSIGSYTAIAAKINLPTSCWAGCDDSQTIDRGDSATYDMSFQLRGTALPYNVYSKVVDTAMGNSGADAGLLKTGVVSSNAGEVTVMSIPYMYTIEVEAESTGNPERAKLSILYQY